LRARSTTSLHTHNRKRNEMECMQMNQSQQAERIIGAVEAYVDGIAIPEYDPAAVRVHFMRPVRRAMLRWGAAVPAAAALAVILTIFSSPTVIAQVERMLHAFASINGQPVPVEVDSVTLDQARNDMPFAVIAPAAIPAGFSETIDELNMTTSRFDSRLLFQFTNGNQAPPLSIMESGAHSETPQQLRLMMTYRKGEPLPGAPALPPGGANGPKAFIQLRPENGQVMRRVRLEPITWVVRGTRVELISPPGLLSPAQLAAIRRAMAR
jgi:hypothetical protein